MTVKVDKRMREKIDANKIDMKKENYIYESPDGGKTIYRAEIDPAAGTTSHVYKPTTYDDVSGVKIDAVDEKAISTLSKRVLELEEMVDKIRDLVK